MKQSDLIVVLKKYLNKEMRKIVREEIQYSVDKEMRSIIREELELLGDVGFTSGKSLNDAVIKTDDEDYESIVPKKKSPVRRQPIEDVKFSNDPMLNAILSETAKDASPIAEKTDWSAQPRETTVPQTRKPTTTAPPDIREMIPPDKRGRDIPDFLQNVLTRDYSELTKKMSEPKTGPSGHMPGAMG